MPKTFTLPLSTLAAQDGTPPAQGDTIDFTGAATVTAVEGETATIQVTQLNGENITEDAAEITEEEADAAALSSAETDAAALDSLTAQ